jgi:hypothetical protein|tara:strand:- start:43 stop:243 length:201 start_codon:yes stop_codon:yes gene_type:complete
MNIHYSAVIMQIKDTIKREVAPGLHSAWVNKILTIIDDVETVADEMTSQGLISMNDLEVDKYESIE